MPKMNEYQVIVLRDSWYTMKPFVNRVNAFSNAHVIGTLRAHTLMYDLKLEPIDKKVALLNMANA